MGLTSYLAIFATFIIGVVFGGMAAFLSRGMLMNRRMKIAERRAARVLVHAKDEAAAVAAEARKEAEKIKITADADYRDRRSELQRRENRLVQKEEVLDRKLEGLERRDQGLINKEKEIESIRAQAAEIKERQLHQLEVISGLSSAEAKQELIQAMDSELHEEGSRRVREWEIRLKGEVTSRAQEILSEAIQRCAADVVSETTTSVVPIPSDDMKGKLIGREGRNIRALEQATGVDLIIDDTPEAVTLSSFDPVRREVARQALTKLILDGRIHPARIESVVAKAKEETDAAIAKAGEQAAYDVGVPGLAPELLKMMGRLKYRTSYGQNVLQHSIETAHIAGVLASELKVNVALAKKAGLLHDIGKAADHEIEGSHADIGANFVKQWDKSTEVVRAIAEHHGETESTSILGFIISAADAISSARPGARRESLDHYLKRLQALEEIANGFKGVEKSYAIQAGREIRILVKPEEIDDLGAMRLARDIVKKIEEGMEYPGQIKVTVLRETRAVDYAK